MFKKTALTCVDSYKLGHADMFPTGTTKVYSNFTARSNKHFSIPDEYKSDKIVWFGLQGVLLELKDLWEETFFRRNVDAVCNEFNEFVAPYCGGNFNIGRIRALHKLGYLPLEIKALPEGSLVDIKVPVFTITNTHDDFFWLPNYLETYLSSELWKMSTSATTANAYRTIIEKYAKETGGNFEFINWQAHDFSVRGMSGIDDAAKSGAGHLISFTGSDNLPANKYINDCYFGKKTFVAGSVPASEHSVMCSGEKENEIETFRNILKKYPTGVVSIVSDTWDFFNVITNIALELKPEILARKEDSIGLSKVVFRPDSGDPVDIICGKVIRHVPDIKTAGDILMLAARSETNDGAPGELSKTDIFIIDGEAIEVTIEIQYDRYHSYISWHRITNFKKVELTPEQKGAVECLWDIFGGTVNDKGFKTLNQKVGLIYGDSITFDRCANILERLKSKGFASDNIVFGVGSYSYQMCSRDTLGFAMKATYVVVNGEGRAIFKDPVTDNGTKKSARGLIKVEKNGKSFIMFDEVSAEAENQGELRQVFKNGNLTKYEEFADIRSRLQLSR
jgi:nicotinamide phosphoribosyltransferase